METSFSAGQQAKSTKRKSSLQQPTHNRSQASLAFIMYSTYRALDFSKQHPKHTLKSIQQTSE